jgi:hypothetical protein
LVKFIDADDWTRNGVRGVHGFGEFAMKLAIIGGYPTPYLP